MQPKSSTTACQGQIVRAVNRQNIAVERFLLRAIAISAIPPIGWIMATVLSRLMPALWPLRSHKVMDTVLGLSLCSAPSASRCYSHSHAG